jgi:Ca-activated chloride channel family protein
VAVSAGLAVILVAYLITKPPRSAPVTCGVQLHVTSSTEKANLIGALARTYSEAHHRLPSGGCATVTVDPFNSGAAKDAIASGWSTDDAARHQRPDVWLPSSQIWLVELRDDARYADRAALTRDLPSVAKSPMVIAMPAELAAAIGWPNREFHWSEVLDLARSTWTDKGHPEWGPFTYAKDDPSRSTSGFAATIASYYAGAGKLQDLQVKDVESEKVRNFVRQIEANVLYHPPDIMDFLAALSAADAERRAQSYVSAVVMQEELAFLYNEANPKGVPDLPEHPQPNMRLVAIHPVDGTLVLDHPYVILPDAEKHKDTLEAARDFRDFLLAPAQRERFAALGFRDADDTAPAALARSLRFDPAERPTPMNVPSAEVMRAIRRSWAELSKRANVLVVVDQSGSMGGASGLPGVRDRMAAAQSALHANARLLNPDDQVGLWGFASDPANLHPALLAQGPYGDGSAFSAAVDRLKVADRPHWNTALCDTIRDAHDYLWTHLDRARINAVVVLTDGREDYPEGPHSCDIRTLGDQLAGKDPTHLVKVFGIGIGSGNDAADTETLGRISGKTGAGTIDATNQPARLSSAFAEIFGSVSAGR